jgi:hypothetical protein
MIDLKAKNVGQHLLKHSDARPLRVPEGFLGYIYPQVLVSCRRMTVREVSNWLEEKEVVYVSAVTVAKALREPAKNWDIFWRQRLWSSVADVCRAHDVKPEDFLFSRDAFSRLKGSKPVLRMKRAGDSTEEFFRVAGYNSALKEIQEAWFCVDDKAIAEFTVPLAAAMIRARDEGIEPVCSVLQRTGARNAIRAATD